MAVVAATKYEKTTLRDGASVVQFYGVSASATDITISSIAATQPARLISVSVKYGAAASTAITVTHNYLGGPGGTTYDVLLDSTTLSADTDYAFLPSSDWYVNGGDTITVVAPALSGQTARVVITMEVL